MTLKATAEMMDRILREETPGKYSYTVSESEKQELSILVRCFAGCQQVYSCVGGDRPVVVLARTVDICERLFVEQTNKSVLLSDLLHDLHSQLVVVGSDICSSIDRRKLVLCRCDLIVLCLGEDSQLPKFVIEV